MVPLSSCAAMVPAPDRRFAFERIRKADADGEHVVFGFTVAQRIQRIEKSPDRVSRVRRGLRGFEKRLDSLEAKELTFSVACSMQSSRLIPRKDAGFSPSSRQLRSIWRLGYFGTDALKRERDDRRAVHHNQERDQAGDTETRTRQFLRACARERWHDPGNEYTAPASTETDRPYDAGEERENGKSAQDGLPARSRNVIASTR